MVLARRRIERTRETEKQKEEGERNMHTHKHTQMLRQRDLHVQPAAAATTDDKLLQQHLSHDTPMERNRGAGGVWERYGARERGRSTSPLTPIAQCPPTYIHRHPPPGLKDLCYTTLRGEKNLPDETTQTMTDNDDSQQQQPKDYSDYPTYCKRKSTLTDSLVPRASLYD